MKRVMLVTLAILLVGASAFAVDFSASVNMAGQVWGTEGFLLNNQNQKDADLLSLSVSTDNAGASAQIWAPLIQGELSNLAPGTIVAGQNTGIPGDGIIRLRNVSLWAKPVSMLKLTVGKVGGGLFTEQLNWWMVPTGASTGAFDTWSARWASDVAVAGCGVAVELTPIPALWIQAGIDPGYGNAFVDTGIDVDFDNNANTKYGVALKYKIEGIGSVGAAFRDNGEGANKSVRLGMDFTMVPGLYAFLTGIGNIDAGAEADQALGGIAIDNFIAYTADKFSVKAEFPVTVRITGDDGDSSYMTFDVKAAYQALANANVFLRVRQNGDVNQGAAYLSFDDALSFNPAIDLGSDFSIGKFGGTIAARVKLAPEGGDVTWAIPFSCRVSY